MTVHKWQASLDVEGKRFWFDDQPKQLRGYEFTIVKMISDVFHEGKEKGTSHGEEKLGFRLLPSHTIRTHTPLTFMPKSRSSGYVYEKS